MRSEFEAGLLEEVEIRLIRPSPQPLRAELGSLHELAASIAEKGLLQPILVRPNSTGFEIVAGNRRFEACKSAGLRKVSCHIVNMDEKESYEAALAENLLHQSLSPVEEGLAFKRYVDEYGYGGESELARRIGISEQYVSQRIRLLSLPKEILEKVSRRLVSYSQAVELIGLDEPSQRFVADIAVQERMSSRAVRRLSKGIKESGVLPSLTDYDTASSASEQDRSIKVVNKCITLLKTNLIRFDDAVNHLDESDWVTREILLSESKNIHDQVDLLLRLRSKLNRGSSVSSHIPTKSIASVARLRH